MNNTILSLKEIAQILNVSPSTVSLVLHDKPGVSDITRERVVQLLKTHGYVDDKKMSDDNKVIRLFKYSTKSYFAEKNGGLSDVLIDSIGLEARNLGFSIVITVCHEGEFIKYLDMIESEQQDGMILLGTDLPLVYRDYFQNRLVPMVIVDSHMPLCNIDSVMIDNYGCIYQALDYLYHKGHRNIGYVHSCLETANFWERHKAFYSIMNEMGLTVSSDNIYTVIPSMNGSYKNFSMYIRNGRPFPSALLSDNDTIAIGCIKALRNSGYRIPEDISVIGFDNNPFGQMSDPSLTTIGIPADFMGKTAVRMLNRRINTPDSPVCSIIISGDLIVRGST